MLKSSFKLISIYIGIGLVFAVVYAVLYDGFSGALGSSTTVMEKLENSIYLSFVTITTLGYGDISPVNSSTKFLILLETVIGIFWFGYVLNEIGRKRSEIQEEHYREIVQAEHDRDLNAKVLTILPLISLRLQEAGVRSIALAMGASEFIRTNGKVTYDPKFPFTNLHEMYHPFPTANVSINETCASEYYNSIERLRDELRSFISVLDPKTHKVIHENAVNLMFSIDCESGKKKILGSTSVSTGNKLGYSGGIRPPIPVTSGH